LCSPNPPPATGADLAESLLQSAVTEYAVYLPSLQAQRRHRDGNHGGAGGGAALSAAGGGR